MSFDDLFDDELDEIQEDDYMLPKIIEIDSVSYDRALKHLSKYRESVSQDYELLDQNIKSIRKEADKESLLSYLEDISYELAVLDQILFEFKQAVINIHAGETVSPEDLN